MIVYAYEYADHPTSRRDFMRFKAWSEHHLPEDTSMWRTGEEGGGRFFVIVVDESHDVASLTFDWKGKPFNLDRQQALAFVLRRSEAKAGRAPSDVHYGRKIAPRLRPDGHWEIPWPGQG